MAESQADTEGGFHNTGPNPKGVARARKAQESADRHAADTGERFTDEDVEIRTLESTKHPHEPEIPPALDSEGRCLVCGLTVRLRKAEARCESYRRLLQECEWFMRDCVTEGVFDSSPHPRLDGIRRDLRAALEDADQ